MLAVYWPLWTIITGLMCYSKWKNKPKLYRVILHLTVIRNIFIYLNFEDRDYKSIIDLQLFLQFQTPFVIVS